MQEFQRIKKLDQETLLEQIEYMGDGMFCDYAKDSAYFRLYTKNEKEAMLKEVEKEAQIKLERKQSFEKCICWKKGEMYCEKHGHNIEMLNSGKCKNCEIRVGK